MAKVKKNIAMSANRKKVSRASRKSKRGSKRMDWLMRGSD